MKTFKVGDIVICNEDNGFKLLGLLHYPKKGEEQIISAIDGNYLTLVGFDQHEEWHMQFFCKRKSITRKLAEQLIKGMIPERSEFDRTFSLNAKF